MRPTPETDADMCAAGEYCGDTPVCSVALCRKLERERDGAVERILPKEPPPGLLMSMAIRFDHALGIPGYYDQPLYAAVTSHDQRLRATIGQMRQLYEEVSGHGFYQPESEEKYAAMIPPKALAGEEGKR
jgi:hypothetical protein